MGNDIFLSLRTRVCREEGCSPLNLKVVEYGAGSGDAMSSSKSNGLVVELLTESGFVLSLRRDILALELER